MNTWNGIGRIASDLVIKKVAGDISNLSFNIAVAKKFKDKDGKYGTDFISCVAWRQQAEFIARFFQKGQRIGIIGSISTRKYKDKDDKTVYITEIYVDSAEFIDTKSQSASIVENTPEKDRTREADFYPSMDDSSDGLPFDL